MNALVLVGGGARGAFQVGVAQAILEAGIPIDIVSGSSVGAINATVIAAGQASSLSQYWLDIGILTVVVPRIDVWRIHRWRSVARPGRAFVKMIKEQVSWENVRKSQIQLRVELTNLKTGEHEIVDNTACTWKHLLASSAIPMLFPPVKIGKKVYVDGSLTQTFPMLPAIEAGADTIFVVGLTMDKPVREVENNLYEMAGRTLEIFLHNNLRHDLRQLEKANRLAGRKGSPYRKIRVIPFFPERDLGELIDFLDFSRKRTEHLIEVGYRQGRSIISRHGLC